MEESEIQTDGSVREDQTAHDDPLPAAPARVNPSSDKSKEAPRATLLLPELLQKMSATLDALLESADRQNKINGTKTEELRSIGADVQPRALEPGLFRKLAPRLDPVALNFTTPVGSSNRPRQQHPSADAKDGQSVLLALAHREKANIGDEPIEVDDDDEDLARQVVPELTKHVSARPTYPAPEIAQPGLLKTTNTESEVPAPPEVVQTTDREHNEVASPKLPIHEDGILPKQTDQTHS
ncbi:hypothetical protein AALP_AAs71737U000100 [Arabis alpina]|uniref:Uncharacterized protein n=1 Tax=Arabis alpina TaxID=50452 RepID=A0A087G2C3_ARAAL|nr:hypothetical protein AALP_AAs71737U000100 [Arabis alpina]